MQENIQNSEPLSFEKVWLMFQETRLLLDTKFQEVRDLSKENELKFQETRQLLDSKFQEVRDLSKENELKFQEMRQEHDKSFKETKELMEKSSLETDRQFRETDRQFRQTDKKIKNLGTEIGNLGNSMGNIAEGLSYPSIKEELISKFNVEFITQNPSRRKKGKNYEIDVFGYSNSLNNEAFIVEVKTTLGKSAIEQLHNSMKTFREFFPEHADKKLYGVLCALKAQERDIEEVYKNGFYYADVKNGFFKIHKSKHYEPKSF